MAHTRRPPTKVLFDTNVWNYLAAHCNTATIKRAARDGGCAIVLAPATVYEAVPFATKRN